MTRAVVFDVGNVLIRWDARLVYRELLPDAEAIEAFFAEVGFHDWNVEQDRGRSWDDAVAALSAAHPHRAPLIAAFRDRWQESVPGEIAGSVEILEELRAARVPLYAITNFSGEKWLETVARFPFLGSCFRDVVVSASEGVTKPDPEIFRVCLERNGLTAAGCVFVDDSAKNVAGALAMGFDAIHFTGPEALRAALVARGVLP
jgi:FMN phosphatase YigB (HAD superfamily)